MSHNGEFSFTKRTNGRRSSGEAQEWPGARGVEAEGEKSMLSQHLELVGAIKADPIPLLHYDLEFRFIAARITDRTAREIYSCY